MSLPCQRACPECGLDLAADFNPVRNELRRISFLVFFCFWLLLGLGLPRDDRVADTRTPSQYAHVDTPFVATDVVTRLQSSQDQVLVDIGTQLALCDADILSDSTLSLVMRSGTVRLQSRTLTYGVGLPFLVLSRSWLQFEDVSLPKYASQWLPRSPRTVWFTGGFLHIERHLGISRYLVTISTSGLMSLALISFCLSSVFVWLVQRYKIRRGRMWLSQQRCPACGYAIVAS